MSLHHLSTTQMHQSEMPTHIKPEAQPRLRRIQRTHWDSKIGLNEYVNRIASSSPSPPPTTSTFQRSTPLDPVPQYDNQADDLPLHPRPRTVPLPIRSRKSLRAALRTDPKAKDWVPDNTIRLLPAIVHIEIDAAAGITLDPQYPPPPAIPKRQQESQEPRLLEVGYINDQLPKIGLEDTSKAHHAQTPQRTPVFIWLHPTQTPSHSHQNCYTPVTPSGTPIASSSILWNPGLETPKQRKEVVDQLLFELSLQNHQTNQEFEKVARVYRRERLEWEIALVRNEWGRRKNWGLFRPGTTGWGVGFACRVGGRDLDEDGDERGVESVNSEVDGGGLGSGDWESEGVEREMREWREKEEEWVDDGVN